MLKKEDGRIDWQKSARHIVNHVRGMSPWPSAFTLCGDKHLKIHAAEALAQESESPKAGSVVRVSKQGIDVACGQGQLRITELQAPGKKRMAAAAFCAGTALSPGFRLDE
jgi:methionyl-tRNA formyltransferase